MAGNDWVHDREGLFFKLPLFNRALLSKAPGKKNLFGKRPYRTGSNNEYKKTFCLTKAFLQADDFWLGNTGCPRERYVCTGSIRIEKISLGLG